MSEAGEGDWVLRNESLLRNAPKAGRRQFSDEEGGLSSDEIIGCIAILAILALIAICLAYVCIRKHCCQRGPNDGVYGIHQVEARQQQQLQQQQQTQPQQQQQQQPHQHISLTSASLNQNSLPTVQRAVDGSQSPSNEPQSPAANAGAPSPGRIRGLTLAQPSYASHRRATSPGQRASSRLLIIKTIRSPHTVPKLKLHIHNPVSLRRKQKRSRLDSRKSKGPPSQLSSSRSRRGQPSSIDRRSPSLGVERQQLLTQPSPTRPPPSTQHRQQAEPKSQLQSPAHPQSPAPSDRLMVTQIQMQDNAAQKTPPRTPPVQSVNLNDVPITADLINRQTKDTQREYSLFKSPQLYD